MKQITFARVLPWLIIAALLAACGTTRKSKTITTTSTNISQDSARVVKLETATKSSAIVSNSIKITFRPDSTGTADSITIPLDDYGDELTAWYKQYPDVPVTQPKPRRGLSIPAARIASIEVTGTRVRQDSAGVKSTDSSRVVKEVTTETRTKEKEVKRTSMPLWLWVVIALFVALVLRRYWPDIKSLFSR